jgi:hypothetical protein
MIGVCVKIHDLQVQIDGLNANLAGMYQQIEKQNRFCHE